jgi:disulfide bond formation protein DsbB
LGKDLRDSAFVMGLDDDELITFLAKGRPTSDPLNTTKVDMPPRGGNPALNEDRLFQVVAYLRWLHKHPGEV